MTLVTVSSHIISYNFTHTSYLVFNLHVITARRFVSYITCLCCFCRLLIREGMTIKNVIYFYIFFFYLNWRMIQFHIVINFLNSDISFLISFPAPSFRSYVRSPLSFFLFYKNITKKKKKNIK